jgi:hypothetical protein
MINARRCLTIVGASNRSLDSFLGHRHAKGRETPHTLGLPHTVAWLFEPTEAHEHPQYELDTPRRRLGSGLQIVVGILGN